MKDRKIVVLPSEDRIASHFTALLYDLLLAKKGYETLSVALSGGSTPEKIFESLSLHHNKTIDWARILFFWSDERCVPPDDADSNYRMARLSLFEKLDIPEANIFRIMGENEPEQEAIRYSGVISGHVPSREKMPEFDVVMLGLGTDGHVASIFPGNKGSFLSEDITAVVVHPQSGQKRITLTGSVINNAKNVVILVTGRAKAEITAEVIENDKNGDFPASHVNPLNGNLIWLLDTEAAALLRQKGD